MPIIFFGQDNFESCCIKDTVRLVEAIDYMDSYDLTFKSLTTIQQESYYNDYINNPDNIKTTSSLKDFSIVFDHIGWSNSKISFEEMQIGQDYIISYMLQKYKKELPVDVTWGSKIVIGNYLLSIKKL